MLCFFQNIGRHNIFAHFLYTQLCFKVQTVVENPQSFYLTTA